MYLKIVSKAEDSDKFGYNVAIYECDTVFVRPAEENGTTTDAEGNVIALTGYIEIETKPAGMTRTFFEEEYGTQIFLMNDSGKTIDSWYI